MLQNCNNTWCPAQHCSQGMAYLEGIIMHEARQPIISHVQVHPLIGRCTLSSSPCISVSWLLLDQNLFWGSCLASDCCMSVVEYQSSTDASADTCKYIVRCTQLPADGHVVMAKQHDQICKVPHITTHRLLPCSLTAYKGHTWCKNSHSADRGWYFVALLNPSSRSTLPVLATGWMPAGECWQRKRRLLTHRCSILLSSSTCHSSHGLLTCLDICCANDGILLSACGNSLMRLLLTLCFSWK